VPEYRIEEGWVFHREGPKNWSRRYYQNWSCVYYREGYKTISAAQRGTLSGEQLEA